MYHPQGKETQWIKLCLSQGSIFVFFEGARQSCWRGDKTTRRVRVRVLALLENPWRVRVRVLAILENPWRDRVLDPARLKNPRGERVLDRWFEARDLSVGILVLSPWIKERGRGCPLMGHEPRTMDLNGTKFNKWKKNLKRKKSLY